MQVGDRVRAPIANGDGVIEGFVIDVEDYVDGRRLTIEAIAPNSQIREFSMVALARECVLLERPGDVPINHRLEVNEHGETFLHRDVDGTVPPWMIEVRDARSVLAYTGTLAQFIVDNDIDAAEVEAMVRDLRAVGQHRWPANEADGIDYVVKLSAPPCGPNTIEQQQGWLP